MTTRRSFLNKSLVAAAGSFIATSSCGQSQEKKVVADASLPVLPSLKGRTVLFTYGGWDGHEPEKFRDYMKPWLESEGATVEVSADLKVYADNDLMDGIDLVIQLYTMSEIKEDQEKGLLRAVKQGTGMAGWHGGMCDAFRNNVEYQYMTGGQWVSHPGGIVDYEVKVLDTGDPVTEGLSSFSMKSEQYYMHIDPNVKVLATTTFNGDHDSWIDGCVVPVAWKKMYGKGRIFYTSLGHNLSHVTDVTPAIEIIKRGIKWASASKYEAPEAWLNPLYA